MKMRCSRLFPRHGKQMNPAIQPTRSEDAEFSRRSRSWPKLSLSEVATLEKVVGKIQKSSYVWLIGLVLTGGSMAFSFWFNTKTFLISQAEVNAAQAAINSEQKAISNHQVETNASLAVAISELRAQTAGIDRRVQLMENRANR